MQLLLDGVSVQEKFPQVEFRRKVDWEQWHLLTADITNSRDSMSFHYFFQGSSNGVEGEVEVGVAAAEGQLTPTRITKLSKLSIHSD